jgi:hypothetical protein
MTFADLFAVIVGTHRGLRRRLKDNRVQLALPPLQCNFIDECQLNSFRVEDFREAGIVAPVPFVPLNECKHHGLA